MARNPELIRAILRQPDDDTVRLVYADWLDENGDPKHAELIRVQCELARHEMVRHPKTKRLRRQETCVGARRETLDKREEELLADTGFHLPGQRRLRYERGFVVERYSLFLTAARAELLATDPHWSSALGPIEHRLREADLPVLDRMLRLSLYLPRIRTRGLKWTDPLTTECLRRVTSIDCLYDTVDDAILRRLQTCPHFDCVTHIGFYDATAVPLDALGELYLSAALPNVTWIYLDGEEWFVDGDTGVEDEHLAEFVARIGAAEKSAQLTYLQLNWLVGPKTAQALLDAPHLRPTDQLCFPAIEGLDKATKAALKKKFGKALVL